MERVASGYGLIEAPVWDAERGLYFSDVLGGGVYLLAHNGAITLVVPKRRGVTYFLVDLHQPTVAGHVSGEDRGEPALWSRHIHLSGSFHETKERSKKALWARLNRQVA